MRLAKVLWAMGVATWIVFPATAHAVELCTLLGNIGFEACVPPPDEWTPSQPNANFGIDAPECSPVIIPKNEVAPLTAPDGSEFIGVVNDGDDDVAGKLVHDVVSAGGPWPAGTQFTVTVFGNRGRLAAALTDQFASLKGTPTLQVQFLGWGPGGIPTPIPASDDWSRRPNVNLKQKFTNWGANGDWASQTFTFTTPRALEFISLAIAGINHSHLTYVAFDVEECPI
jgi:hypothetical protein